MPEFGASVEEDLQLLDAKVKQLKNEYEQYFLGSRPREPTLLRSEVQKMVTTYANIPIQNTGYRFKFNNLRARFFAFRRHWDETLRKIEDGRYERHVFKANLRHGRPPADSKPQPARPAHASGDAELFDAYISARKACGQSVDGLSPEKLAKVLDQKGEAIRKEHGFQSVQFRVVVEQGQARLKAAPKR